MVDREPKRDKPVEPKPSFNLVIEILMVDRR